MQAGDVGGAAAAPDPRHEEMMIALIRELFKRKGLARASAALARERVRGGRAAS